MDPTIEPALTAASAVLVAVSLGWIVTTRRLLGERREDLWAKPPGSPARGPSSVTEPPTVRGWEGLSARG